MTTKQTFSNLILSCGYKHDIRTVFDDFLTLTLCAFSQNPATGKSYDEGLYLQTIGKYANDSFRHEFPKLLAQLSEEMTSRLESDQGFDVLGEFYEQHLSQKRISQIFTPWPICTFMAKSTKENVDSENKEPLRILDPACGSGRMLMASSRVFGPKHYYFGIDIDMLCVKMTAVNLFLSGLFTAEAMCANALMPDTFECSYATSFMPLGVFRIAEKEQSVLYKLHKNSFGNKNKKEPKGSDWTGGKFGNGEQLRIF